MKKRAIGLVAVVAALCLPATSNAAVPFERHGTLQITKGGLQDVIRTKYEGPFPEMGRNEFVMYAIWQTDAEGSQPRHCNAYPPARGGSPDRKRPRRAVFEVFINSDPNIYSTRWCPGRWTSAAYVYKKRPSGWYTPRLQFASKSFRIG